MSWEGDILKKLRKGRELTQAQFAEWLEIPKRTYEKWESGESVPPIWVIKLIRFKCEKSNKGEQISIFRKITKEETAFRVTITRQLGEQKRWFPNESEAKGCADFWQSQEGTLKIEIEKFEKVPE